MAEREGDWWKFEVGNVGNVYVSADEERGFRESEAGRIAAQVRVPARDAPGSFVGDSYQLLADGGIYVQVSGHKVTLPKSSEGKYVRTADRSELQILAEDLALAEC